MQTAALLHIISNAFVTYDNLSELIRKISPTYNSFEFIYQVAIKFWFQAAIREYDELLTLFNKRTFGHVGSSATSQGLLV